MGLSLPGDEESRAGLEGEQRGGRTFQTQNLQKPDGHEVREGRGRDKAVISGEPSQEELHMPKKDLNFIR